MPTLYIFRGLAGTGKTTFAKKLFKHRVVDFEIASDDYPGIYENGEYQFHLQGVAHDWCLEQTRLAMVAGKDICVHNTFDQRKYFYKYLEAAKKYGYYVHVIHNEKVFDNEGVGVKSVHNVPSNVIENMRNSWEPLERGFMPLTPNHLADVLNEIFVPEIIIADVDGTIKLVESGSKFPLIPTDIKLNPDFVQAYKLLNEKAGYKIPLVLASNQRGVELHEKTKSVGKSVRFLKEEMEYMLDLLHDQEVFVEGACFATHTMSNKCLHWDCINEWQEWELTERADKPGSGMARFLIEQAFGNDLDILTAVNMLCWIVGDGHTPQNSADLGMCRDLMGDFSPQYVPIELMKVAANLATKVIMDS